MARKETISTTQTLLEPGTYQLTEQERKCEELVIRANLNFRPVTVGTVDLEKLIPRVFYGYIWLTHKNSIVKVVTLDFENKTIFRNTVAWRAEIPIQLAVQLINIPNAEPGTVAEQTAVFNLLTQQENNGAYYFPFPQPVDAISYWFPAGVSMDLVLDVRPWSDILNPDGSIAIPTLPNVEEDDLLELPPLGTFEPEATFEDACAAAFPENWTFDEGTSWKCFYVGTVGTQRFDRAFRFQSRTTPGIVGVPETGQGNFPPTLRYPAVVGNPPCSELTDVNPSTLTDSGNISWARQRIETSEGQAFFVQTAPAGGGVAGIDFNSISFSRC